MDNIEHNESLESFCVMVLQSYDTMSIDPKDFEGQTVLILGRGGYAVVV